MRYNFDWDPQKERTNLRKHGISFRRAATVFRDPNQTSLYDDEHSLNEDRWITLGLDSRGVLCVVIHTFEQIDEGMVEIRIISARTATKAEGHQYQEGTS